MFLIPSRERPHRLAQLINACLKTKMSAPAIVMIDDDDPCLSSYLDMAMPSNWTIEIGSGGFLSEIYNRSFNRHPNEKWYGILCDDAVPETEHFDLKLIYAAGENGMAVPAGGDSTGGSPHFVLGGDLVRKMGWVALPGLSRLYIDTIWYQIALSTGVHCFRPDIIISHHHFSNRKALMDKTYRKPDRESDRIIYGNWCKMNGLCN